MNNHPLAIEVGQALQQRRWWLATAESCTGGLVGSLITAVAGSSAYYVGGIISYSNDVKIKQLGVEREIIETVGAVSGECAQAMAEGARARLGADVAVAITGIAGPGGGSAEKPVGLVYIAAAIAGETTVERHVFTGERQDVQQASAEAALALVLRLSVGG